MNMVENNNPMPWQLKKFTELTTLELYYIYKLRSDIFVVEQDCVYPDLDGLDILPETYHLFATSNQLVMAYLRLLAVDTSYPNMSALGRVVIHPDFRGQQLGHQLLSRATQFLDEKWPEHICHISAQSHLAKFYQQHGYSIVTDEYLEDGIPHIGMERPAKNNKAELT
ncbi:GNAT family N-acetyltransferase [Aliikangiella maris]|uniref:GNAT family N-acetyltransferase n=2 Tax=Aliikangiella maris TaxID=3162458 RepID=A0ABV3MPG7_9GAMM